MIKQIEPFSGMMISKSVCLKPGTYSFPDGKGLVITADNITIDGSSTSGKRPTRQDSQFFRHRYICEWTQRYHNQECEYSWFSYWTACGKW
jgi:hypothetical protein